MQCGSTCRADRRPIWYSASATSRTKWTRERCARLRAVVGRLDDLQRASRPVAPHDAIAPVGVRGRIEPARVIETPEGHVELLRPVSGLEEQHRAATRAEASLTAAR